jgi:hypothetical protein
MLKKKDAIVIEETDNSTFTNVYVVYLFPESTIQKFHYLLARLFLNEKYC